MQKLDGCIALVTGASRGVGKGIAVGLGEAGATVYLTARSHDGASTVSLPGTLEETAATVEARAEPRTRSAVTIGTTTPSAPSSKGSC